MRSPRSILRSPKTIPLVVVCSGCIAFIGLFVFHLFAQQPHAVIRKINYTQLREASTARTAASLSIEGETFTVAERDGTLAQAVVTNGAAQQAVIDEFSKNNVPVEFRSLQPSPIVTALNWLVPLLTIIALGLVGWRLSTSMSGRGGDIQVADQQALQGVTFANVAGIDEAKAELVETIEFLRDPAKFGRLGGRAPRGILLSGAPGTGKTLLARAAANEAGVPFLTVSGSSFQEKFAGLGAARVRRLFARARKIAPCIIFIDEIDSMGRQRGRGNDSATADADQTLNQLLVEMDGFNQLSSIVIMASTNRPDMLDSALRRPGRFDREVSVALPDVNGRESILRIHSQGLKLEPEFDLGWVARGTSGFSGADLANLLNEAAIAATRDNAAQIERGHIEHARDRILMGAERHGFMVDEEDRYATAVHEAGHAAVGLHVKNGDPIHKVSILPRGRALGVAQFLPERDRLMKKREYLEDQIAMLLGGRAAEQVLLGTMTAGASNDIERAVEIARRMVTEFGMSSLGPIHLGKPEDARSQSLLDRVEQAVSEIINEQMKRACEVVEATRGQIATLVMALMEQDTLDAHEIHACFGTEKEQAAA
ncbi:MAG: ATP-dependent zinc metalloprotease FtsH [Pyrinomonadaceae bacterium]|nr:ATP-dependent zinc metalloprotease FtsH [Pyrinomonadaceae bacterium]